MFSYGRFSLSRFSLGDGGSVYKIEQTFGEGLNAVAGAAIPVETTAFFNDVFRGSMRGAIAVRSGFLAVEAFNTDCKMRANILMGAELSGGLFSRVIASQNSCIRLGLAGELGSLVWGSKIIPWAFEAADSLTSAVNGVKDIQTRLFPYEVLTAIAGGIKQATEIASFAVTLPPGAELRIDSDTFRVTLDGENVLYAQAGDWVNLSRELLYLDIESATGGSLQGTIIYTERYL